MKVRVLATKLEELGSPAGRLVYHGQVYSGVGNRLLWTCSHDHRTPVEAHACSLRGLEAGDVGDVA